MRRFLCLLALPALAADLPPDKGNTIPDSARRPVVVTGKSTLALPKHDLQDGYTLEVAAASPLVTHPIMGCLDDKGRLFVGDATGVNWNKKQLEENPPNRVLMLEDTDKDGAFDKSTIFADKMTFPQGACWLDGSLYVGSPPSIWKLTDTDNDGVADKREEVVTGFDYTGNAADIHGPFLHPNGRLYWCHGRKGHDVKQKDGTPVDASLACGIWSCKPDGSDVAWHSLGCGDNPVEVDFTRSGDIIGVQNLYYTQPRGDTIIHWLYGGVYERSDQLKAIAHLPRTLETMPVMYNFGHVAVSGCCFWRSYPTKNEEPRTENLMVTHFNTQRLVRMELTPSGSTYKAVENEFLKLHNPDIHLTDVMEDPRDGSLLLIDTGGWFRIGCPSSLMAKSDLLGAVYRIKPKKPNAAPLASRSADASVGKTDLKSIVAQLNSSNPHVCIRACQLLAQSPTSSPEIDLAMQKLLASQLDSSLQHAVTLAAARLYRNNIDGYFFSAWLRHSDPNSKSPDYIIKWGDAGSDRYMSRILLVADAAGLRSDRFKDYLLGGLSSLSEPLIEASFTVLERDPKLGTELARKIVDHFRSPSLRNKQRFESLIASSLADSELQSDLTYMLEGHEKGQVSTALNILATQTAGVSNDAWLPLLDKLLSDAPTPLVLDAIKKLKSPHFDDALQAIASDTKRPLSIRLKALDSAKSVKLNGETFDMVKNVLADAASSSAAKIQAAGMLAAGPMPKEQVEKIAPLFATVGPVELKTLLPLLKRHKDVEIVKSLAREIAKNPAIASQQESLYRTALADLPPEIFETIILPAYNTAVAATEAKKRQLGPLADKVIASGNAANGEKHFKAGKGTCIACHKIGDTGRAIGPDLSHIGTIRTERDLLESILFPSNTLARDYEAHIIETSDGQQTLGVIKSHTAEGLLVLDIAGQEKNIPHQQISGDTTLITSLMPMGLDQTMPESELLDLVAWLRSLK
ncbi:MAG: c-type cytochrome [Prosthecobacter sp.]|jgi:putative membrane-bound dehydrogenase-like protein|uniref:PVC-type heme-binding CxxCH protein n=1 Tax=Prosthecobacter sp. TaxID=1965333 RepID=UPI0019FA4442|nr:PVC-type heme-binding CxxCH protein [Prosthecobacter sp.]MBE2284635.1 c-type cytochrome [Prosthecobacter sp.]